MIPERGHALGLGIRSELALQFLGSGGESPERWLTVALVDSPDKPPEDAQRLIDRRLPDGSLFLAVDRHDELGYRIEVPGLGCHLLSPDGTQVSSTRPGREEWRWYHLLFAQVLPTAAALQGLEVLHASAVALAGKAVAIVAASGQGKSSLAGHLVASGAQFVTDDVLSISSRDGTVLAHPGPAFARFDERELDAMRGTRVGELVAAADKQIVAPRPTPGPLPLQCACFLRRENHEGELRLKSLRPPDPRLLLSATFVPHLSDREAMSARLRICAELAGRVPCFELRVPPGVSAARAAELVLEAASGGFEALG